jgi:purine-binding chemotaxis protein CheW
MESEQMDAEEQVAEMIQTLTQGQDDDLLSSHKYLSFVIHEQSYGIPISRIKEIIEYVSVTRVPMVPGEIRGVINLRGRVVPVVDLSVRLDKPRSAATKRTCIVIVEVVNGEEKMDIGFVVDAVTEVMNIADSMTEPPPPFGLNLRSEFVQSMGKIDNGFAVLLDVDKVLSIDDLAFLIAGEAESALV